MAIANALNAQTAGIQGMSSTGVWTGTSATNHAIVVGGATASTLSMVGPSASTGQVLQSAGAAADPAFSTATYPSTAGTSGKILISDGTNIVSSTPTYPNAASTALKHIKSDGTNFVTTTVTYPDASVTAGKVIVSDGTNYIASTPTFPNASATTGKFIISDGTNWIASTPTIPSTAGTSGKILISDGTNFISSTPTYPNSASTALKHIKSDGTNFVTTTVTYPDASVTAGKVIISDGTNYIASTPTFPNSATGTGTILRADGTNWVATTSTYPNTNAVSTLLYASSANVMAALATANSGVLTTDSSGVPSIDITNFVRQTTGMQMKGNNTNTAPPAGFIGEQIRATIASASAVTVNNLTATNITSISLTAGIWDVSAVGVVGSGITTGTSAEFSISITSATRGTSGDNAIQILCVSTAAQDIGTTIPSYRLTLSGTTTVYLVAFYSFAAGTGKGFGRISGTRVG